MRGFRLGVIASMFVALAAGAFGQAIQQSGAVVPFHVGSWLSNGVLADGGEPDSPFVNRLGLFDGASCPFAISSQTTPGVATGPYSLFSICQTDAATTLTFTGENGQPTPNVYFNIGGTIYPFVGFGTVTSVGLSLPSFITVTGSPVTSSGTLTGTLATQAANLVFAGPATGSPATPNFRALVTADLPDTAVTPGSYTAANITVDAKGRITAAANGVGGGGTITSITAGVGLTGGTITTSGTIALANPSASTLGGVESLAAVSHNFLTSISTFGVPAQARPACGDLSDAAASCATDATNATNIASGTLDKARLPSVVKVRGFGTSFGDTGGSALSPGSIVYFTVPYACTISAWNMTLDAGTATIDIWKIASGTAVPTIANTITAAALPAISTGTAKHSTTLTAWTTAVSANDIFGFDLQAVSTAKYVEIDLECDQ